MLNLITLISFYTFKHFEDSNDINTLPTWIKYESDKVNARQQRNVLTLPDTSLVCQVDKCSKCANNSTPNSNKVITHIHVKFQRYKTNIDICMWQAHRSFVTAFISNSTFNVHSQTLRGAFPHLCLQVAVNKNRTGFYIENTKCFKIKT